jgi:uracil-DNA glycosylase
VKSGSVSRDNPDQTAKAFNKLLAEAGIAPAQTLIWNVVPWYIGNAELTKIRPARVADLREAEEHLVELLGLLPVLSAVVLVGRKAQHASVRALIEREVGCRIDVFECYHPSPLVLNGRPHNRQKILHELKAVGHALDKHGP